jgi:hypothetical protein
MEFKAICNMCPAINDCKEAFGKFWGEKSNGGKGCRHPFGGWSRKPPPALPKMPRRKMKQANLI